MKTNFSARWGILLLLALFGLLMAASTVLAVRISREVCLVQEYDALMEDLHIVAREVSDKMDGGDREGFSFIELTARIEADKENFSYVVRDSSGHVLAPAFVAGKELRMKNIKMLRSDGSAFLTDLWGSRCFVVKYAFPDRPLELLGIYDSQYVFGGVRSTILLFISVLSAVFLVLLLLAWFWIIPSLEKVLDKKQKAERELETARQLQQKAVTKLFPSDSRCQVHALLQPAREVGGDIYRCKRIGDKLFFAVGDVSDKGMAAAYVMFLLSSVIESHSASRNISLTGLMGELNNLLLDNAEYDMFCTLFMGSIDLGTLEFEYCNAGHTKTVLNGAFLEQDPQLLAGITRDFPYRTEKMQLLRGARLLLYTDGVTEARNADGGFFGPQRLLAWMRSRDAAEPCEATCSALIDALTQFRGGAQQNDDIAIMCIKI